MTMPGFLQALVDDAAMFPPGNAPLDRAVAEHYQHRRATYAELVGGFVASDRVLPELLALLSTEPDEPASRIDLKLVVTGGAGAIEPAVGWATRSERIRLTGLEIALRDEEDLAHNARRMIAAVDALEADLADVPVYVEPPRNQGSPTHGWLAALDELAARELRLKFRTGGVTADAFPGVEELAGWIDAALDRETAFKCTAGLHHAITCPDPQTGATQHGFLNVLLATRASLDGENPASVLADTDLRERLRAADLDALAGARRWFVSFGSCSIVVPRDELAELDLVGAAS
ncbi:MAG: hypothetical protein M3130_07785 [Actinomycetota bacterium]|nr:hypothetical protein [Actinomycetota bacterium]